VTVLEASPVIGGKLRLGEVGGIYLDLGAEALLARQPAAVELIQAVGLGDEVICPHTTAAARVIGWCVRLAAGVAPGHYQILAAINALHTSAREVRGTEWSQVAGDRTD
jgi:phytoene dehydrogenase-like protein